MAKKLKRKCKVVIAILIWCVAGVANGGMHEVKAATYGDYEYEVLDDGTVEITSYSGKDTEIEIPSIIDGKKITSIGAYAFADCIHLTNIEIPSSVVSIGTGAFDTCISLTSIVIPNGVASIGEYAFADCIHLTNIEMTSSVSSIGTGAFAWCSSLSDIKIPSGVTSIDGWAFTYCISLINIEIPSGVTSIGDGAFDYCHSLTSIAIPSSVTSISGWVFTDCPETMVIYAESGSYAEQWANAQGVGVKALDEYPPEKPDIAETNAAKYGYEILDNGTAEITSYSGYSGKYTKIEIPSVIDGRQVTGIGDFAFFTCKSIENIKIPNGVTSIGWRTFKYCIGLTDIEIPSGVTSIGEEAFAFCISLTNIKIPSTVTDIGYGVFDDCPETMVIYVESGSYAEQWAKDNGFTVKLLDKDTSVIPDTPKNPDTGNQGQTEGETDSLSILPKVGTQHTVSNSIYKVTKSSATNKEVTFVKPKSSKKTSVTIPTTIKIDGQTYKVMEVASKAFKNNKNLKSVIIGKNVKKIGKEAFSGCKKLKKITIKSTVLKGIGKNAIKGIDKKATIKCPKKQLAKYKKLFKSKTGYKKTMKIKK